MPESDRDFVKQLVKRNRYLTLATTEESNPWIATLEYIFDDDLNLYFFSPEDTTHSVHIRENPTVAISIFDPEQPEYEPADVIRISGVQGVATAHELEAPFPDVVKKQIDAWGLPMPPYAAYKITAVEWFIPVLKDGVNERLKVSVG